MSSLLVAFAAAQQPTAAGVADLEFFEREVRPLLHRRCIGCHGPDEQESGLRLDHLAFALRGGERGPALRPADPDGSRLLAAVSYRDVDLQMPPKGALPAAEIDVLRRWIALGAPWPDEPEPESAPATAVRPAFDLAARRASHWAWRPLVLPAVPGLPADVDPAWPRSPIDRFVAAAWAARGLGPAAEADRATLLRRLSLDLTGLPPTAAEQDAFLQDRSPAAYERLVDRLLASPQFGERWARHWLDLVRWSETLGHEYDYALPNAWRYRDYVVRALNQDLPYDQFVREHIAGDLLDPPRRRPDTGANESIVGTASWLFGEQGHSPVDVLQHGADRLDNQIDVLTKTFLGLTVSCARCHDHKFDAISQRDYYSLVGFARSSRYVQAPLAPSLLGTPDHARLERAQQRLLELAGCTDLAPPRIPAPDPADVVVADFDRHDYAGWTRVGDAFGLAPTRSDVVLPDADGRAVRHRLGGGWANSGALGTAFQGVLQSPSFGITRRYLHVLTMGCEGRLTLFLEGFQLVRSPIYGGLKQLVDRTVPHWLTLDLGQWPDHRAVLEFSDQAQPDLADTLRGDGYSGNAWLAVRLAVLSDREQPPGEVALAEGPEAAPAPGLCAALAEWEAMGSALACVEFAPALADGAGIDAPLLVRGNPRERGAPQPRRFLAALAGEEPMPIGSGSGRRELADAMLAPDNPFPARVMANRIWHHLLGRGIVATVDNLGQLGEPPTHPELLDWLAVSFRVDGWSIQRLIRRIVCSATYRMDSRPVPELAQRDPDNRWLHRANLWRLEGEVLRDAMLAVAGRLDPTLGGPSVPAHLTRFLTGRGRPRQSGPLDGAGRRSLYLEVRRNFLSPWMQVFDVPMPFGTVGARSRTNVPAQALALMNDPLVHELARHWAERVLALPAMGDGERIAAMYRAAFARLPDPAERDAALGFLACQAALYDAAPSDPRPWADLGHVLFQLTEFSHRH